MTRVTLIHNRNAGDADHTKAELIAGFKRAGCTVRYISSKAKQLKRLLAEPADIVAVVGGDGTVGKVARATRPNGAPIGVLAMGTANNIARSLGLDATPETLVASWKAGERRPFHLIEATGPWGARRVAEGAGFGVLAKLMAEQTGDKPDAAEARLLLSAAVEGMEAEKLELNVDGEELSGAFRFLAVTNIAMLGPNVCLTPIADPSDRLIELCFVDEASGRPGAFASWLAVSHGAAAAPLYVRTGRRVTVTGKFHRLHLDDELYESKNSKRKTVQFEAEAEPIHFLVPSQC